MCISRVGSSESQKLARTTSRDGGKTWSTIDRLPAFSVAPQVCRTANGTLLLSTGRPGLWLWLCTDSRGIRWQNFDVVAHHNASVDQASQMTAVQTTAYTAVLEVEENRVLLAYDRTPFGWQAVPADSGERSQIYLLELRVGR